MVFSVTSLCFWFFLGYYIFFGLLYVFWSYTSQETTGRPIRPPFTIREFSVLTRLKIEIRESGKLPRSELPFRPFAQGPWRGVLINGSAGLVVKKNNTQERHKTNM